MVLYLPRAAVSGLGLAAFSHYQKQLSQGFYGPSLKAVSVSAILALLSLPAVFELNNESRKY
jgi:hypothetical protein